jgi:hypothetical protein
MFGLVNSPVRGKENLMMGNETTSRSPNPAVIILAVLLVGAVIWAIVATATVEKRNAAIVQLQQSMDQLKAQTEQKMAEADKIAADSEKLRKVALKWTIQSQKMIQELQAKKAAVSTNAVKAVSAKAAKSGKAAPAKAKAHHPKAVAQH